MPADTALTDSDDVFARLRSDIVMGALAPGSRLRFAELKARYGVGTSPLREALSRLAAVRLVAQEANRGFQVQPLNRADFQDIVEMRCRLEGDAARASVARGDEAWEERLLIAHRRLVRLGRQEELLRDGIDSTAAQSWEARHRALHHALIAACGSPWTLHFCDLLNDQFDRYRRRARSDAAVQAELAPQHGAMVEAALARDSARVAGILVAHIRRSGDVVLGGLPPEA
ncbi:MAG: GntR family transcriptional regulator [Alphaproteobacteria bacterium]